MAEAKGNVWLAPAPPLAVLRGMRCTRHGDSPWPEAHNARHARSDDSRAEWEKPFASLWIRAGPPSGWESRQPGVTNQPRLS